MNLIEYLTSPQTITSLVIAIGGFYAGYKVLEKRVEQNEKDVSELKKTIKDFDIVDIKTKLSEIQTNIAWIMKTLQEKK